MSKVLKLIYLSGFMGSGKTHTGRVLSKKLQCPFIDIDKEIEKEEKQKISTIFNNKGERYFRQLENQTLLKVSQNFQKAVISLGGGAVLSYQNRLILNRGVWINLNVDKATLLKRLNLEKEKRPLIKSSHSEKEILDLLEKRQPYYNLAPYQVYLTNETADYVTEIILKKIRLHMN